MHLSFRVPRNDQGDLSPMRCSMPQRQGSIEAWSIQIQDICYVPVLAVWIGYPGGPDLSMICLGKVPAQRNNFANVNRILTSLRSSNPKKQQLVAAFIALLALPEPGMCFFFSSITPLKKQRTIQQISWIWPARPPILSNLMLPPSTYHLVIKINQTSQTHDPSTASFLKLSSELDPVHDPQWRSLAAAVCIYLENS